MRPRGWRVWLVVGNNSDKCLLLLWDAPQQSHVTMRVRSCYPYLLRNFEPSSFPRTTSLSYNPRFVFRVCFNNKMRQTPQTKKDKFDNWKLYLLLNIKKHPRRKEKGTHKICRHKGPPLLTRYGS